MSERAYDIVTFDCYGTLVDWESGISDAFRDAAFCDGLQFDREEILRLHAEIEPTSGDFVLLLEDLGHLRIGDQVEGCSLEEARAVLRALAGLWSPYLQDGKRHRILSDDEALTAARLGLSLAVRVVLKNGLALLGISAPEQM